MKINLAFFDFINTHSIKVALYVECFWSCFPQTQNLIVWWSFVLDYICLRYKLTHLPYMNIYSQLKIPPPTCNTVLCGSPILPAYIVCCVTIFVLYTYNNTITVTMQLNKLICMFSLLFSLHVSTSVGHHQVLFPMPKLLDCIDCGGRSNIHHIIKETPTHWRREQEQQGQA
jgi:hypothetical protein